MSASHACSSIACSRRGLLVDLIERQIERLIPAFDVAPQKFVVRRACQLLGGALAIDPAACAPEHSRINADGTPFQFALRLSATEAPALQFLGESARRASDRERRGQAGFECLEQLGDILGLSEQVTRVRPWLDAWTRGAHLQPEAVMAGVLWFGVAFVPGSTPTLTVYLNNAWGGPSERWQRLAALNDRIGGPRAAEDPLAARLSPHGAAVVLRADGRLRGRAYFSGFGVAVRRYRDALSSGADCAQALEAFDAFVRHVMGDDACYPTLSSVYSRELGAATSDGVKVEMCAHCAFDDDRQAAARVAAWLTESRTRPEVYCSTLDTLLEDRALPLKGRPAVHSFVGVGIRRGEPYASIYLNPGPVVGYRVSS